MTTKAPPETDRRGYPRVELRIPVLLAHESGAKATGHTADIAPGGMQVRCHRQAAARLHPSGRPIHRDEWPRVDAVLRLPLESGTTTVQIGCRMVHLSLLEGVGPAREAAIGLLFERFDHEAEKVFERFFTEFLVPREPG